MRTRIAHLWELLTSSYWFIPSLMTALAVAGAILLLRLDADVLPEDYRPGWLYSGGAEGARAVLATVAGSVITVGGVVFSITIATLTQASGQFGPRLLRQFMRDRSNQVVLGTFVATFIYCLLVMRVVRGDGTAAKFVPQLSVTVGVGLAVASMAVLIYFIHHIARFLQAPIVVAAVAADLQRVIGRLPERQRASAESAPAPARLGRSLTVLARASGYIGAIDFESLAEFASEHGLFIELGHRAGQYVMMGGVIAEVWASETRTEAGPPDREIQQACRSALLLGPQRTPEQDLEFSIHQLVEVGVRALSPGINDPFTAINCIDALGSALARIAGRELPPALRTDEDGAPRVRGPAHTFDGLADAAFNQLRQHGRNDVAVTIRLLEVIAAAAHQMESPGQRAALRRHAELIRAEAGSAFRSESDLADVHARHQAALAALDSAAEAAVS